MMEKYDVMDTTRAAGGGEYPTQDGFGWTNGITLALEAQETSRSVPAGRVPEDRGTGSRSVATPPQRRWGRGEGAAVSSNR
jgi:hypothetical protein